GGIRRGACDFRRKRFHTWEITAFARFELPRQRCTGRPSACRLEVRRQRTCRARERNALGLVDEIDEREGNVAYVRGKRRGGPFGGPAQRIGLRDVAQMAQRGKPPARENGGGLVGARAEHADRASRLVPYRRQREGTVDLTLAVPASDEHAAFFRRDRRVRLEHVADLGPDRVPDLLANLCGRPPERPLPPEEPSAGVIVQVDELRSPPDEGRRGAREHQTQRRLQALRP